MKQFSLEEYLRDPLRTVVTRDGRNVRIICTDKRDADFPIVALVECENKEETCYYTENGCCWDFDIESVNDLFFAPEKHEGWVNIYVDSMNIMYTGACIHKSKDDAEKTGKERPGYVTTIKIEWEG